MKIDYSVLFGTIVIGIILDMFTIGLTPIGIIIICIIGFIGSLLPDILNDKEENKKCPDTYRQ